MRQLQKFGGRKAEEMSSTSLFCAECGLTAEETPLFRDNHKGEPPIWKCSKHVGSPVDSSILRVLKALEAK